MLRFSVRLSRFNEVYLFTYLLILYDHIMQKENLRLELSTVPQHRTQPPPTPTPPPSPSFARTRYGRVLRRRRPSLFPGESSRHSHLDGQEAAQGGPWPGAARNKHLLSALTIEPVRRGQSSAADQTRKELEVTAPSPEQEVINRTTSTRKLPTIPAEARPVNSELPTVAGNKLSTVEPSVRHLYFNTPRKNTDAAAAQSTLQGRGELGDGRREQSSLPLPAALRRNQSENSFIVRGLPSKIVPSRHDARTRQQRLSSRLSEARQWV